MFKRKPNPRIEEIDKEISRVLAVMARMEPDHEEYASASANWTKLCAERANLLPHRISKDQLVLAGSNVLVALVVIGYERAHVITTKIPSFMSKATR